MYVTGSTSLHLVILLKNLQETSLTSRKYWRLLSELQEEMKMENKKKKSTNSFEKAIMLEVMGKYFLLIATILVSVSLQLHLPAS